MKCYHHPSRDAVAQCKGFDECYKGICRECYDAWKVNVGPWANQPLCFECCEIMIKLNAQEVLEIGEWTEKARKRILIGSIIGGVIGGLFGIGGGFAGFLFGAWVGSGVLGMIIRNGLGYIFSGGWWPLIISALIGPFFCLKDIIADRKVLEQARAFAASEMETLQLMRDYFQYSIAMEKYGSNDSFESLTSQGGELFNNSYARSVKERGEQAAQAHMHNSVVQIAANGEIIRNSSGRRRAS